MGVGVSEYLMEWALAVEKLEMIMKERMKEVSDFESLESVR